MPTSTLRRNAAQEIFEEQGLNFGSYTRFSVVAEYSKGAVYSHGRPVLLEDFTALFCLH